MTAPIAPFWLNPSAPGQLSNKRGANTGADALSLQIKYANARATGDAIGGLRLVATKPTTGLDKPISTVLDTWWTGVGDGQNLPAIARVLPNATFVQNGRVYILQEGNQQIYSAPVNGPFVGTWRQEQAPGALTGNLAGALALYSMVFVGSWAYVAGSTNYWYSAINADGTFTNWTQFIPSNDPGNLTDKQLFGYTDGVGNPFLVVIAGLFSTWTRASKINLDGSITAWTTGGVMATNRGYGGIYFAPDANQTGAGTLSLIGGNDGTNPLLSIAQAPITITAGQITIGAWANAGTGIPAVRSHFAFCILNGFAYVIGGIAAGAIDSGAGQIQIARIAVGSIGTAVWTVNAASLAIGTASMGCIGQVVPGGSTVGAAGGGGPVVILIGGSQSGTIIATVMTASANASTSALVQPAAIPQGTELTSGNLGTGGVVTNNADGSVSVTYVWQTAPIGGAALVDGDVVTVTAYTTDAQGGDLGPSSVTVFKVGQIPTISGITVLPTNNGRPVITFNYSAGAGGDVEFSYRVQVAPNGFDSGTRYDSANSMTLLSAPYLPTAVGQTVTITVVSRDSPMSGSTNQAVNSATVYTPTLTGPGTPSGLTATPNHASGSMAFAWTNNAPAGTTPGNRVYYRRNGTSTWFLLLDLGVATSATCWDRLALGVAYDFAVSQVDNNNFSESVLSNIVTNKTIDPVAGGYSGFLHIQGNGSDQSKPSAHNVPLLVQGTPDVTAVFDTTATLPFQQLTPTVTLGVAHYVKLKLGLLIPSLAVQKLLMDVIATAYAGNVMVYRDGLGGMITCQIDQDQALAYLPPVARLSALNLVQIPDQYTPSTPQGFSTGYLQQVFNSITPLDPAEAFL